MSDLPERIWAWGSHDFRGAGQWREGHYGYGTEYVRADAITSMRAEIARLRREVAAAEDAALERAADTVKTLSDEQLSLAKARHANRMSHEAAEEAARQLNLASLDIRALPRDGSALDAVVAAPSVSAGTPLPPFEGADWFWRDLDPDDCGDTPGEAINRSMQGNFTVCHIRSSFSGPSKFCFTAPVLDPGSDDEECLCFDTQEEAIAAAKERRAALAKLDGGT
jgi:hypothetical protein